MSDSENAEALREVAPGIFEWSVFHPEKGLDFNGHLVVADDGNVAIDPPHLSPRQLDEVWERGGVAHVILTNCHHGRNTSELVQRTQARTHAHRKDADALDFAVDEQFEDGAVLPGGLRVVHVPASKSPGECALLVERDGGTLILGDALIGRPEGKLSMLPDEKFKNPAAARKGLLRLLDHQFGRVLVGDGKNPADGRAAIEDYLVHHGLAHRQRR